jgi:transposase
VLRRWDLRLGEKRGLLVGKTKRGKGTKLVVLVDGQGTPLGLHVDSASPSEVRLLVQTLETVRVGRPHRRGRPRTRPERLIADKGYDSNAVRQMLHHRGIAPIIPARRNNTVATHQDGRVLRRYRRRWMVERTISWLQNFRRLTTRWDRSAAVYTALAHLACALVVMKRVLG